MDEWMELAVKMTNDAMTEFDPSLEGVFILFSTFSLTFWIYFFFKRDSLTPTPT
jgi:hypothetical protein